jgi:hypothetical protein
MTRAYVAPACLVIAYAVGACGPTKSGSETPVASGAVGPVVAARSSCASVRAVAVVAAIPATATHVRGRAIQRRAYLRVMAKMNGG